VLPIVSLLVRNTSLVVASETIFLAQALDLFLEQINGQKMWDTVPLVFTIHRLYVIRVGE